MPSLYGQGLYGVNLYSQSSIWGLVGALPPSVVFSANLSIVGRNPVSMKGDLTPSVAFAGTLNRLVNLVGSIQPSVTLKVAGFGSQNLFGDIAPQVTLGASLAADRVFGGHFFPKITLAASLASGPLWKPVPPCQADWEETELCDG